MISDFHWPDLRRVRVPDNLSKGQIDSLRNIMGQRMQYLAEEFSKAKDKGNHRKADLALTGFIGLRDFLRELEAKS